MSKKIVIFENITVLQFPILDYYLKKNAKIYVFDFVYNLKKYAKIRCLINENKISRVFIKPNCKANGQAIDLSDQLYKRINAKHHADLIADLYDVPLKEADVILKKELVKDVFKYVFINNYLSNLGDQHINFSFVAEKYYYFEKLIKKYSDYEIKKINRIKVNKTLRLVAKIAMFIEPLKFLFGTFFYLLYYTLGVWGGRILRKEIPRRKEYDFAVPLENIFHIKFDGARGFDFLLDGEKIKKSNTVFLLNISLDQSWIAKQKEHELFENKSLYTLNNLRKYAYNSEFLLKAWRITFKSLKNFISPAPYFSAFFHGVYTFLKFNILSHHLRFANYVYTNNESTSQLCLNILFRQQSIITWNYLSFWVGGYPRSKGESFFNDHRNILWSFLNSDFLIGVNEHVNIYMKLHRQTVRNYLPYGSLYSEMIKNEGLHISKEQYIYEKFDVASGTTGKILTIFDTSFVDEKGSPASLQEGIEFYKDIIKLIKKNVDLLFIIKTSKDDNFFVSPKSQWASFKRGKELIDLWNILRKESRVFFAGDAGDIVSMMAVSDLVITHCMSSTTGEALGARKKAVWYESGRKHEGLLYDRIPGLIIHGFENLENRINELLYRTSEEQYNTYLDQYIKGVVESNLDGMALSRFRTKLVSTHFKQD